MRISYCSGLILIFFLFGCATFYNPITGRQEAGIVDTGTEILLSRAVAAQSVREYGGLYKDEAKTELVNRVGWKLAKVSDRPRLPWKFGVVNSKVVNAFAAGGGYVFVTRGLLDKVEGEGELAAVMGHEIGHTSARHVAKQMEMVMGYQIAGTAAQVLLKEAVLPYSKYANLIFSLINHGYGRKAELEADRLSARYLKRAGYDPGAMVSFLKKLQEMDKDKERYREAAILFQSHPLTQDRITAVMDEIRKLENQPQPKYADRPRPVIRYSPTRHYRYQPSPRVQ